MIIQTGELLLQFYTVSPKKVVHQTHADNFVSS